MAIYELSGIELDAVSAGTTYSSKYVNKFQKVNAVQVNSAVQTAAAVSVLSANDGSANNLSAQSNNISQ